MACPAKLELQRACTTAWDSYAVYANETGIPVSISGALLDMTSFHRIMARMWKVREASAPAKLSQSLKNVAQLRGEHMKASRALSLHLARHRC